MKKSEIINYVRGNARREMADLISLNKNGFHALAVQGADIGWDKQEDGSIIFILFLPGVKHIFRKQNVNAPLEYVRAA
jgi:hypothetical protein